MNEREISQAYTFSAFFTSRVHIDNSFKYRIIELLRHTLNNNIFIDKRVVKRLKTSDVKRCLLCRQIVNKMNNVFDKMFCDTCSRSSDIPGLYVGFKFVYHCAGIWTPKFITSQLSYETSLVAISNFNMNSNKMLDRFYSRGICIFMMGITNVPQDVVFYIISLIYQYV